MSTQKTTNKKTNSERIKEEKKDLGWDPVFSFLSDKTIKSKIFLPWSIEKIKRGKR